jgi:hypothetical protein
MFDRTAISPRSWRRITRESASGPPRGFGGVSRLPMNNDGYRGRGSHDDENRTPGPGIFPNISR